MILHTSPMRQPGVGCYSAILARRARRARACVSSWCAADLAHSHLASYAMGLAAGMANALLFFMLFVALILAALIVFSYAAYSFLVAFVNTAAGNDEVHWPGDPIQDWFFKLWYFLWLLAFWVVPVSLILGILGLPPFRAAGIVLTVLWLIFPV